MQKTFQLIWGKNVFITPFLREFGDILHQIKKYAITEREWD